MFRCNLTFYESKNFLIPLSITFLNPEILGLLFCEKYPNLGSEVWKIKLPKILGNLLDKIRKLHMNGTVI